MLSPDQVLGVDVLASTYDEIKKTVKLITDDNALMIQNIKISHIFPGGPTCYVRDTIIFQFITYSPSGGITSEILTNIMMQRLGQHLQELPRHKGCPTPQ